MFKFCPFFCLSLLLLSSSCKKEKEYPTYYMDQELKDYVVFPVGSYWVYEEETSGEIDSVYLYRSIIKIDDSRKIVSYNYEGVGRNLSSSYYQDTLFGGGGAFGVGMNEPCGYAERYISNFIAVNLQFFSNRAVGDSLMHNNTIGVKYESFYSSHTIAGTAYADVKVFRAMVQEAPNLPERTYYSRHIGVIRKELFNGQVWNLKRYYIAS